MPSPLIRALAARSGLPFVDETSIEAFLAPAAHEPPHTLLFFTGDPAERTETHDVAVVLPELLDAFPERLRAAVVTREAEAALKARFHVQVVPSLVVTRGAIPLGVMPKIRDWSDYIATIERCLAPGAPPLAAPMQGVRITHGKANGAPA
jgi:hydrogenase-1 operon protein HyaE